jgi:hypothetical protein
VTLAEVAALADVLRAKGVRVWKDGPVEMELGPPIDSAPDSPAEPEDICRCGHPFIGHSAEGLCVTGGCDVEACAPPEAAS